MNLPRWARAVLFSASVLALWLVAAPALAADPAEATSTYAEPTEPPPSPGTAKGIAPLCDDRGATMLAPPPVLQEQASSLDVDEGAGNDCSWTQGLGNSAQPEQRDRSDSPSSFDATATLSRATPTVPDAGREIVVAPEQSSAPTAGVRSRLERPPRA